jgi:hypothetical protein
MASAAACASAGARTFRGDLGQFDAWMETACPDYRMRQPSSYLKRTLGGLRDLGRDREERIAGVLRLRALGAPFTTRDSASSASVYRSPVAGQRHPPPPSATSRDPAPPTHPIRRARPALRALITGGPIAGSWAGRADAGHCFENLYSDAGKYTAPRRSTGSKSIAPSISGLGESHGRRGAAFRGGLRQ